MILRGKRGSLGLLLLVIQILNVGIDHIPPVTLTCIVSQAAIFLDLLHPYFPSSSASVCLSSYLVWTRGFWSRLILAPVYHLDDMHLYYNMASFLVKGVTLERKYGSLYFTYMVAVFTVLTSVFYVVMGVLLADWLQDIHYLTDCAVGFSGVLFALKVVTTHHAPRTRHVAFGVIPVPSRIVYWIELLLIQLMVPNASWRGHLAGIMVGLLYIKGPLKTIMDCGLQPKYPAGRRRRGNGSPFWLSAGLNEGKIGNTRKTRAAYRSQYSRADTPGSWGNSAWLYGDEEQSEPDDSEITPQTSSSTLTNSDSEGLSRTSPFPGRGLYPDLQELRQKRTARFQRNKYR